MNKLIYISITVIALILFGCSDYQKLLKSSDYELKYTKAIEYYEDDDYFRALSLLEELITIYKGTKKAEDIYYYYCYCHYNQDNYVLAGYHYKNFARTYPNSKRKEECLYQSAYCHYLNSPIPSLDQSYTHKAINELQLFINKFPDSYLVTKDLRNQKTQANVLIINNVYINKSFNDFKQELNTNETKDLLKLCSDLGIGVQKNKKSDASIVISEVLDYLNNAYIEGQIITDTIDNLYKYLSLKNRKDLIKFNKKNKLNARIEKTDSVESIRLILMNKMRNVGKFPSCNELIDKLRWKLEIKSFNNAKLYYDLKDYKAAIVALKNSLLKFPDTQYREELLFLILKSSYMLAENSINKKKVERYNNTLTEYHAFIDEYSNSNKQKSAERIYDNTLNKLDKLKLNN